jgi:hypothetical protein
MKNFVCGLAIVAFAGAAFGQVTAINSVKIETYIPPFNVGIPSDLTVTNNFPSVVQFDERNFAQTGGFANKHQAMFSKDGVHRYYLHNNESFQLDFDVNMDTLRADGQPRKEGGVVFYNPRPGFTDEGRVHITTDGEIAVFGAAMPFTGFGNTAYAKGTDAHMSFRYYAPGEIDPLAAYRLIATTVNGVFDSGIKLWGIETDGTNGFNDGTYFGFVAQHQRLPVTGEFATTTYGNVKIVPAPGAAALLGLAGLVAGRRRR